MRAGEGGAVTHQEAVTIIAPVVPGQLDALRHALQAIRHDPAGNASIPFGRVDGLHFARLVLLEPATDLDGEPLSPKLLFLLDCDARAPAPGRRGPRRG
ncbi:MAG: hypothetical protein U5Q44_01895 [Dehalococcoidia bacterium]|nr:hypothetical protein [Dehalococcoidia bacterium]